MTFDEPTSIGHLGTCIRNLVGLHHGFAINHAAASTT